MGLNTHSLWGWGLWDSVTASPGSTNGAFCPTDSQGPSLSQLLSASSLPASPFSSGTAYLFPGSNKALKKAGESQELVSLVP